MKCNPLICNNKFLHCVFLLHLVYCSHEDKADKFGSNQEHIGKVKFAYIDPLTAATHRFVVATEDNVLACLRTRTGSIIWKQNLGKGKPGEIDVLSEEGDLITVNGGGQFVRSWDQTTGELLWETTFPHPQNSEAVSYFKINTFSKEIIKIEILPKKHAKVYVFDYARASLKTSDNIASRWFDEDTKCNFFSSRYFMCMEPNRKVLQQLSVKDTGAFTSIHLSSVKNIFDAIPDVKNAKLVSVPYQDLLETPYVIIQTDNSTVVTTINPPGFSIVKTEPPYHNVISTVIDNSRVLIKVLRFNDKSNENSIYSVGTIFARSLEVSQLHGTFSVSKQRGELLEAFILPYKKKDHGIGYKLLVQFEDNSLLLCDQQGQFIWSREQALSDVALNIHRVRSEEL